MSEGAIQRQPTDREGKLREILVPEIYKLCEGLDQGGLKRIEERHSVGASKVFTMELGNALVDLKFEIIVRRA